MLVGIPQNNKYKQGYYTIRNREKYRGDCGEIIYRSSWEKRLFKWLDSNYNVLEWASEEICINYVSPIDNKQHRYFPDVWAKVKNGDKVTIYLIEVKPYKKTLEPKVRNKVTKQYINEVYEWGINTSKWKAAKEYCNRKGWVFKLMTDKDIPF
jgi:hypothetical protein